MSSICENDMVIIRSVDDKGSYVLKVSGEQKLGKSRVYLKELIGKPYGSVFELVNRTLTLVKSTDNILEYEYNQEKDEEAVYQSIDNREIKDDFSNKKAPSQRGDNSYYVDTNTAQKLKDSDIIRLKENGFSGEQIIQTLIQNSDTFASKTDFAQEKWIKRKERKYRKTYRILKCNPYNLCDATFEKSRDKICNMRPDSLAQVISQSGVHSGSRVLVMESMVGLVVGSIAYRMRGSGRILACYGGQQPHFDMVANFNLDSSCVNIIQPVPSVELGPAAEDICRSGFCNETKVLDVDVDEQSSAKKQKIDESASMDVVVSCESVTGSEEQEGPKTLGKRALKAGTGSAVNNTGRGKESQAKLRTFLRQGVDSLVIACKYRPLPILRQALYCLLPSSPFVLYHEFLEPLVECYLFLQQSGLALRLVLSDTWMREFQTLPGRVRPDMFMSTSGGFILSGIYVGTVPCKYTC